MTRSCTPHRLVKRCADHTRSPPWCDKSSRPIELLYCFRICKQLFCIVLPTPRSTMPAPRDSKTINHETLDPCFGPGNSTLEYKKAVPQMRDHSRSDTKMAQGWQITTGSLCLGRERSNFQTLRRAETL